MSPRRSVLAMAVLSMLGEEPMHAYRMHQLIKERHKDDVVNVRARNSLYQTLQRLLRDELVEIASTERAENRPERTTYRITGIGAETLQEWLHDMLATPSAEFPHFPAALSFLPSLSPASATRALDARADRLAERLTALDAEQAQGATFLPRLFLIEGEYEQQVLRAELAYVRGIVDDLRQGRLSWPFPRD